MAEEVRLSTKRGTLLHNSLFPNSTYYQRLKEEGENERLVTKTTKKLTNIHVDANVIGILETRLPVNIWHSGVA